MARARQDKNSATGWTIIPHLASAWDTGDFGQTYRVNLRSQSWTNGDRITAQDVKYSFERIAGLNGHNLNAANSHLWDKLSKVEVVNDDEFLIHLNQATSSLAQDVLPWIPGCVVSRNALEKSSDKRFYLEPNPSSGRYKIAIGSRIHTWT